MTITAPEAPGGAPALQHKSSPADVGAQTLSVTPEGLVTAIVSVTGVVDEVKDLLIPGCYTETLAKRRPKVIRAHNWNEPVGRVLSIEEWMPGDPRLPKETKDGHPWPAAAGALTATLQYNLDTERGRVAFADVSFYSETKEAEFSIGYQVPQGAAVRTKDGVRHVRKLDLFEISDVLFGAAPLSMTLAVKNSQPADGEEASGKPGEEASEQPGEQAVAQPGEQAVAEPAQATGVAEPAATEPVPAEPGTGEQPTDTGSDSAPMDPDELEALHAAAAGEIDWDEVEAAAAAHGDAVEHPGPTEDPAPSGDTGVPAGKPDPGATATETKDASAGTAEITADELAEGLHLAAGLEYKRKFTAGKRDKLAETGKAMDDGSFPIENATDLKNAIGAYGRAKDQAAAKAHIVKRAKELKLTFMLPKGWSASTKSAEDTALEWAQENADAVAETIATGEPALELKAQGGADKNSGNAERLRHYWQHEAGVPWGVPGDFMDCVTKIKEHMSDRHAKGYCALRHKEMTGEWPGPGAHGGKLAGKIKEEAVKGTKSAEPDWSAVGAPEPGDPLRQPNPDPQAETEMKLAAWDPLAETGPQAAHLAPQVKVMTEACLPGTLEEKREAVRAAVCEALKGEQDPLTGKSAWDSVTLLGTYPDKAVAIRENFGDDRESQAFELPYLTGLNGQILVGAPMPVTLELSVQPSMDTTIYNSVEAKIAEISTSIKALLGSGGTEVKEGRVLSRVNLSRLRAAVTALLSVLAAAGVPIDTPSKKQVDDEKDPAAADVYPEGVPLPDSTAPSAQQTKAVISAAELAEGLALLGM